jgi:hypothetical protein
MTLVAADLLSPSGEIDGALFYPQLSSGGVSAKLGLYITAAASFADGAGVSDPALVDELSRAWIYYRAWNDVVQRLTLTPATASLGGEVSTSFLQTQINEWIKGRDMWRAAYLALIPLPPGSTVEQAGLSQAVDTVIRW